MWGEGSGVAADEDILGPLKAVMTEMEPPEAKTDRSGDHDSCCDSP